MAITDNLVSIWKCDEASGNLVDSFGANTLTQRGTVAATTGKVNGCRDIENASDNQFFDIADNVSLSLTTSFTIALWCKPESHDATVRYLVAKGAGAGTRSYRVAWNATPRFTLSVSNDGTVLTTALSDQVTSDGNWYFVFAYYDSVGQKIGISVNDSTPVEASHTTGIFDSTASFKIGDLGNNTLGTSSFSCFDGLIDEVAIWGRVLTSGERTSLYNAGNGLAYPWAGSIAPIAMHHRRLSAA